MVEKETYALLHDIYVCKHVQYIHISSENVQDVAVYAVSNN